MKSAKINSKNLILLLSIAVSFALANPNEPNSSDSKLSRLQSFVNQCASYFSQQTKQQSAGLLSKITFGWINSEPKSAQEKKFSSSLNLYSKEQISDKKWMINKLLEPNGILASIHKLGIDEHNEQLLQIAWAYLEQTKDILLHKDTLSFLIEEAANGELQLKADNTSANKSDLLKLESLSLASNKALQTKVASLKIAFYNNILHTLSSQSDNFSYYRFLSLNLVFTLALNDYYAKSSAEDNYFRMENLKKSTYTVAYYLKSFGSNGLLNVQFNVEPLIALYPNVVAFPMMFSYGFSSNTRLAYKVLPLSVMSGKFRYDYSYGSSFHSNQHDIQHAKDIIANIQKLNLSTQQIKLLSDLYEYLKNALNQQTDQRIRFVGEYILHYLYQEVQSSFYKEHIQILMANHRLTNNNKQFILSKIKMLSNSSHGPGLAISNEEFRQAILVDKVFISDRLSEIFDSATEEFFKNKKN